MTDQTFFIALIQQEFKFLDLQTNKQKALDAVSAAADRGAQLICLPEGFLTGYNGKNLSAAIDAACTTDDPSLVLFFSLARERRIHLLLPFFEKSEDGVRNTALLIDDQGEIAGRYSKTHLIGAEKDLLIPGDCLPVWETCFGRIGCLICYDMCFPETARTLALKGAQLILVPAAWRDSLYYDSWWELNAPCRALDNVLYLAAVGHVGDAGGGERFTGRSMLCGPTGDVIAAADETEETIVYGGIDLSRIEKERTGNTVLEDLRRDLY